MSSHFFHDSTAHAFIALFSCKYSVQQFFRIIFSVLHDSEVIPTVNVMS